MYKSGISSIRPSFKSKLSAVGKLKTRRNLMPLLTCILIIYCWYVSVFVFSFCLLFIWFVWVCAFVA